MFLLNVVLEGFGRYTAILGEPTFLNAVIYIAGLLVALVGLLGFYPRLVIRTPRLARVSAAVVVVAGLGLAVLVVWASITTLLNQPMPPGVLLILSLVAVIVGFLLFTAASLLTGIPSRTVSLLLVAFVVTWVVGLALSFVAFGGQAPDWLAVALNGVSAVVMLAIGYDLRTDTPSTDYATPSA